jgi:hypothetical protein
MRGPFNLSGTASDGDGVRVLGVGFVGDGGYKKNTHPGGGVLGVGGKRLIVEEITKMMLFQIFFNFFNQTGAFS